MAIDSYSPSFHESQSPSALTLQLLDEILSVFSLNCVSPGADGQFDESSIGYIPASSFVNVARQLGLVFTASEARCLEREFMRQNLDLIDVDKFVQLVDNKIKLDNEVAVTVPQFTPLSDFFNAQLDGCYDTLDWQKSGKLPTSDLKHMLSCFNDGEFDGAKLNALFRSANLTNKRIVSREDFKAMFLPLDDTAFFSLRVFEAK